MPTLPDSATACPARRRRALLPALLAAALLALAPLHAQDATADTDSRPAPAADAAAPATVKPPVATAHEAAQSDAADDNVPQHRLRYEIPAAPLLEQETTPEYTLRRALGPVFEYLILADGRRILAVRPFYSSIADPNRDFVERDYLWPLLSRRHYGDRFSGGGLFTDEVDLDVTDPESRWYWHFFPLIFTGQTAEQAHYFAVFPLGGRLLDAFTYDRIDFWAFPVYARTQKKETVGRHWFYPVYGRVQGPKLEKFHVWPLYGMAETKHKWVQRYVFWPFVNWGHDLDPSKEGSAFFLFPIAGYLSFRDPTAANPTLLESRTFLWPFFSGKKTASGVELNLPWPFFRWSRNMEGPGTSSFWLWPLYGHRVRENAESWNYLWPVIWYFREQRARGGLSKRYYLLPFYWHHLQDDSAGQRVETYQRFWPFLSYTHRPQDGTKQIQVMDIVPMRRAEVLDRNLKPFWTFYTYFANDTVKQHELLWGLYSHRTRHGAVEKHSLFPFYSARVDRNNGTQRLDLLTGLVGTESFPTGHRRIKLFWFMKLGYAYEPPDIVRPDALVPDAVATGSDSDGDAPPAAPPRTGGHRRHHPL